MVFKLILLLLFSRGVNGYFVNDGGAQERLLPGGPDDFGYRWVSSDDQNGPSFNWIDATTTGQGFSLGDEQTVWVPAQNFSFWFYGRTYSDSIAISSNGWVSFTNSPNNYPHSFPDQLYGTVLSIYGTDLDACSVYVAQVDGKLVVEWLNAPHFDGGGTYTFEVVIDPSDSSITFQYLSHTGAAWPNHASITAGIQEELSEFYLPYSKYLIHDSLAVKFYYQPEVDLAVEILHPSDNGLSFVGQPDSVLVRVVNSGRTAGTDISVICKVDSSNWMVFEDTAVVSMLRVGDTSFLRFSSWLPTSKFPYRVVAYVDTAFDTHWSNNYDTIYVSPTYVSEDTLSYFEGGVAGSIWRNSQFQEFGLEFHPDTLPFLVNFVAVWLVTPNDSGIPIPDSTPDPIVLKVWTGSDAPERVVFQDTLWRDELPPGWVYAVPSDSLIVMDETFWVSVASRLNSTYGMEAIGVDASLDYPDAKWICNGGRWSHTPYEGNDPLIFVAGNGLDVPFRGDLEVEYLYPAWSYILSPNVEESLVVKIKNLGPLPVSDGVVYCSIDSADQSVYQSQIQLSTLNDGAETTITFSGFFLDGDFPYPFKVWVHSDYDPVAENDTITDTLMAVENVNDTLVFGVGDRVGGVWTGSPDEKFALELDIGRSFRPRMLAFWLISPGEPLWPMPDTTLEPVVVEIWNGATQPESLVYADTVWRDNQQPGWVYSIPIDSLAFDADTKIWVALSLCTNGGCEALAVDSSLDFPDAMWVYSQGTWVHSTFANGDPFVKVFLQEYGNLVEEYDGARPSVVFGFTKDMSTIVNSRFRIKFGLPEDDVVTLKVYDVQGRMVSRILKEKALNSGYHSFDWQLSDKFGHSVPSGVYFLELKTSKSHRRQVRKLLVVR